MIGDQLKLYAAEYGFTSEAWKAYVADGVNRLVERFGQRKGLYADPGIQRDTRRVYRHYPCRGTNGAAAVFLSRRCRAGAGARRQADGACGRVLPGEGIQAHLPCGPSASCMRRGICIKSTDFISHRRGKAATGARRCWKSAGKCLWKHIDPYKNPVPFPARGDGCVLLHAVALLEPVHAPAAVDQLFACRCRRDGTWSRFPLSAPGWWNRSQTSHRIRNGRLPCNTWDGYFLSLHFTSQRMTD